MRESSVYTAIAIIQSRWRTRVLGGVEIVVRYPTYYLKPEKQSRIVREVVYAELERLAKSRASPDVALTANSVYTIYTNYQRLDYSVPELLSVYQVMDRRNQDRIRVESVPWELVPKDILERCLDSNMELTITAELMNFLGFECGDTIFDKHSYPSRLVPRDDERIIESPVYSKETGKLKRMDYLFYDEENDVYRRAITKKKLSDNYCNKTIQELEFVVEMFNPENEFNSLGLRPKLLAKVILSIYRAVLEYRKEYFGSSYIDRLAEKSVEELRKERLKDEREYAVSLRGRYDEDTSVLWRYGQLAD